MTPPHWATLGIRRIMILITITVPTTSGTSQTGKIGNNDNNPPCKYHVLHRYKSYVMLAEQL